MPHSAIYIYLLFALPAWFGWLFVILTQCFRRPRHRRSPENGQRPTAHTCWQATPSDTHCRPPPCTAVVALSLLRFRSPVVDTSVVCRCRAWCFFFGPCRLLLPRILLPCFWFDTKKNDFLWICALGPCFVLFYLTGQPVKFPHCFRLSGFFYFCSTCTIMRLSLRLEASLSGSLKQNCVFKLPRAAELCSLLSALFLCSLNSELDRISLYGLILSDTILWPRFYFAK